MSTDERYNGWANRETWAVALHINNDQGWQESVNETLLAATLDGIYRQGEYRPTLREGAADPDLRGLALSEAGLIIRENVEDTLETLWEFNSPELRNILTDFGSLWRVDWTELGAAFLSDLDES